MTRPALHYDAVVIGAGTAGLVAGIRLAQSGASVCVLAKGVGCTHLAPGTIDVLGYAPERVDSAREGLAALSAARRDHPYALIGVELLEEAILWFEQIVRDGPLPGYHYVGGIERNMLLPSALGALRPSALVPHTMSAGERGGIGRVCIVGTPALRDFHPGLCAANLRLAGVDARALQLELELERADMTTVGIARRLDSPRWRARFCARLAPLLGAEDSVGLPAMLGVADPHSVHSELEDRLGRRVFEIPTLPPSVPGMRLYEILRDALRRAGGRFVLGGEVIGHTRKRTRVTSVRSRAAGRDQTYSADSFVLASGGFASGGIELDSNWVTTERIFGLRMHGVPAHGEPRFVSNYLEEQPLARAGVAVDPALRARGCANVLVAGAALAGAAPWHEGSGEGLAISSGYLAAQTVVAGPGSRSEAVR